MPSLDCRYWGFSTDQDGRSAPGRLVHSARRRIVRIIEIWPTIDVLLGAYGRVDLIT